MAEEKQTLKPNQFEIKVDQGLLEKEAVYDIGVEKRNKIIDLLSQSIPIKQITDRLEVNPKVINRIKKDFDYLIGLKKYNVDKTDTQIASNIVNKFSVILDKATDELISRNLKDCSPPQLALVIAIAFDKYRLAVGESTENILHKFQNKQEMIDFIEGRKKEITLQIEEKKEIK